MKEQRGLTSDYKRFPLPPSHHQSLFDMYLSFCRLKVGEKVEDEEISLRQHNKGALFPLTLRYSSLSLGLRCAPMSFVLGFTR